MKIRTRIHALWVILSMVLLLFFLNACVPGLNIAKKPDTINPALETKPKTFPPTSREAFVQLKNVVGVYAIDEYHTAILPKRNAMGNPVGKFYDELKQICDHYGTLLYTTLNYDSLTEKKELRMVPAEEKSISILASLKKPWEVKDAFHLSDLLLRKIPYSDGTNAIYWTISKEPKDRYGFPKLLDEMPRNIGGPGFMYSMRGIVVKHKKPQEFIFKTDCISDINEIDIPGGDGNLSKNLPKVFSKRALWNKHPREVSDLFQYLVAYSKREKGTHKWVIVKNNRKVKTNDYQAFLDIQSSLLRYKMAPPNSGRYLYYYPVWFFCYESPEVKFIVKQKKDKYYIYHDRTIDEL